MKWSDFRPFPDPSKGEYIYAPFGPGVYELYDRKAGKYVLVGSSKNVALRMSSLLPKPIGAGTRDNTEKVNYVKKNLINIDYRTKALPSKEESLQEERRLRHSKSYLHPS